ncbi:MAG: hypothetical protein PVJ67_03325 [Candidatus Pacearchaeota archaeon]|jgi:hypothetical protein
MIGKECQWMHSLHQRIYEGKRIGRPSSFNPNLDAQTSRDYIREFIGDVRRDSKNPEENFAGITHNINNFRDYTQNVEEEERIKLNEEMAKATLNLPYCRLE